MRSYLRIQLSKFNPSDFSPLPESWNALVIYFAWATPAALVVSLTRWRGRFTSVKYLDSAIAEGIGPHLWNVVGTLGIVLFGLFILQPRSRWIAVAANNVLINTYAIGALTFGLLFGQWSNAFASANLQRWQIWANGAGFGFLFSMVLVLNFSLWYLSFLSTPARLSTGFAASLSKIDFRLRSLLGVPLMAGPVLLLLMEQ